MITATIIASTCIILFWLHQIKTAMIALLKQQIKTSRATASAERARKKYIQSDDDEEDDEANWWKERN
jgi:hypothetical protein